MDLMCFDQRVNCLHRSESMDDEKRAAIVMPNPQPMVSVLCLGEIFKAVWG